MSILRVNNIEVRTGSAVTFSSNIDITGSFDAAGIVTASKFVSDTNATADNGGGNIYLNGNSNNNRIDFRSGGANSPAFNSRSTGTKITLWPAVDTDSVDYAFGIDSQTLWYSVPQESQTHKWYGGTTEMMSLSNSNLTVEGKIIGIGSVGIGSDDPTVPLDVAGAANFGGNVEVGTYAPNGASTTEGVRLTTGGFIGISATDDSNSSTQFRIRNSSGTNAVEFFSDGSATFAGRIRGDGGTVSTPALLLSANNNSGKGLEIVNAGATTNVEIGVDGSAYFAGNISFADGQGIDFSSNSTAGSGTTTSSVLDDYEEGTFIPTIATGADDGAGGAPPLERQAGRYTKIGNKVYCDIYFRFANGAFSNGANVNIGGLPFLTSTLSYGNVNPAGYTRGGGTSTFHNTTSDITTNYATGGGQDSFRLYINGGTDFIFGGVDNANLNGLYWIGTYQYHTD